MFGVLSSMLMSVSFLLLMTTEKISELSKMSSSIKSTDMHSVVGDVGLNVCSCTVETKSIPPAQGCNRVEDCYFPVL